MISIKSIMIFGIQVITLQSFYHLKFNLEVLAIQVIMEELNMICKLSLLLLMGQIAQLLTHQLNKNLFIDKINLEEIHLYILAVE